MMTEITATVSEVSQGTVTVCPATIESTALIGPLD